MNIEIIFEIGIGIFAIFVILIIMADLGSKISNPARYYRIQERIEQEQELERKQYLLKRREKEELNEMKEKTLREVIFKYNGLSEADKQELYSHVCCCLTKKGDYPLYDYDFTDTESLKNHLLEHYNKGLEEKFVISIVNSKCVFEKLDKNSTRNYYFSMLYTMP